MMIGMRNLERVALILTAVAAAGGVNAAEGEGRLSVGYILIDEEGNRSVNQETFNLYEGFDVSVEDFGYRTNNGLRLRMDLRQVTLENRRLELQADKAKLFSLSIYDNKYRRIYSPSAAASTKRESAGGQLSVHPVRQLELFGGLGRISRRGHEVFLFDPSASARQSPVDYSQRFWNAGAEARLRAARVRVSYRDRETDDNTTDGPDRRVKWLRTRLVTPLPLTRRALLVGGYQYRGDDVPETTTELVTNLGWGAMELYFPGEFVLDYRILFARTDHEGNGTRTDNLLNAVSIGRRWRQSASLRVGYENHIADDPINRSEAHRLLLSGWIRRSRLHLRALTGARSREIVSGSTLLGDEEHTRYLIGATLSDRRRSLSVDYRARTREHDATSTRADFHSISTTASMEWSAYGKLSLDYTYYLGQFENRDSEFELADHVLSGALQTISWRGLTASLAGSYFRSLRDRDIEKFSIEIGVEYQIHRLHSVDVRYSAFNFDDFQTLGAFYTGNIVRIALSRDFSFSQQGAD